MINFGIVIKKYRSIKNLTQLELCQKVKITPAYLSAIENGKKDPSFPLLKKICRSLKLPIEVLLWESVKIGPNMKSEDKKIIELAKTLLKHYSEHSQ